MKMLETKAHIEKELLLERNRFLNEIQLLNEVRRILDAQDTARNLILQNLQNDNQSDGNHFNLSLLESDRIFHLKQIRTICIDYRLRFLDSLLFKNGIPEEAITKIHDLEKIHKTTLKGFKIMAPTKAFQLLSYDDPLLFAPIGNEYYYLIHKWGNDLTPKRKWLVMPFKNLMNFVWLCLVISLALTFLTPQNNLSKSVPMANIIIFLFAFKSVIAVFLYAFFMMGKNFNTAIWDRKYFNN